MDLNPGDIYWAFSNAEEPNPKHPFVVVSRAELNRGKYVLAVPFTSTGVEYRRALPTCVFVAAGECGLEKSCVAQAEALTQLQLVDLAKPVERIGKLSPEKLHRLISAIGYAIGARCVPEAPTTAADTGLK